MIRTFVALVMLLLTSFGAQAGLIGQQVRGSVLDVNGFDFFAFSGNPQPATVADPAIEFSFQGGSHKFRADFSDDRLVIQQQNDFSGFFSNGGTGITFTFEFLTPGLLVAAELLPDPTWPIEGSPVISGNQLTFVANHFLSQGGVPYSATILLTTREPGTPMPEPGTLLLSMAALLGLGLIRQRAAI